MLHQRGGGGVFGNVRTAFHGEADVGGGKRGRVVDAVADHRHGFAGGFEFLHFGGFVARTHITEGVCDAQLFGDVFDRTLVIAAHNIDIDIVFFQTAYGFGGIGFQRVGECECADRFAVYRYGNRTGDFPNAV